MEWLFSWEVTSAVVAVLIGIAFAFLGLDDFTQAKLCFVLAAADRGGYQDRGAGYGQAPVPGQGEGRRYTRIEPGTNLSVRTTEAIDVDRRDDRVFHGVVEQEVRGENGRVAIPASALLLASLGIFGVLAYSVEQRQREFGIRTALGAQSARLLAMVMRQGLSPVAYGFVFGAVAALLSGSLLQSLVFGVSPFDLFTYAGVALLITFVAAMACYIPARRATKVDPMEALRYE